MQSMVPPQSDAISLRQLHTVKTAAGVPTTRPLATIESSDRLQDKISFVHEDKKRRSPFAKLWKEFNLPT